MINVNEKLLDVLDADQYYLVCKLMKYGKRSCPKNSVLVNSVGWGVNKIQKVKKQLVELGMLEIKPRFKILDGRRVKDSNEYLIKSKLISKYNGVQSDVHDFQLLQIHLHENEVHEFHVDEFEVRQNGVDNKLLSIVIIDNKELLKERSITPTPKETKISVAEKIKRSAAKLGVKSQASEKEKSCAKKEKSETPEIAPIDLSDFPAMHDGKKQRRHEQFLRDEYSLTVDVKLRDFKFPYSWSLELIEQVVKYFYYMADRDSRYGATATLTGQISICNDFLKRYTVQQVIDGISHCISRGNGSHNPQWKINADENEKKKTKKQKATATDSSFLGLIRPDEQKSQKPYIPNQLIR